MTDRVISFDADDIDALRCGRKTQFRKLVSLYRSADRRRFTVGEHETLLELEPGEFRRGICHYSSGDLSGPHRLPHAAGDRLSVRYRRQGNTSGRKDTATPLARTDAGMLLIVTDVRVHRVGEISWDDAAAEGWPGDRQYCEGAVRWFKENWKRRHGESAWDLNPWVSAYTVSVSAADHGYLDSRPHAGEPANVSISSHLQVLR